MNKNGKKLKCLLKKDIDNNNSKRKKVWISKANPTAKNTKIF